MLSAFWVLLLCPFLSPTTSTPKCQFHFLLVFMEFAMTFHLGGLNSKGASFLELGLQRTFLLGLIVQKGTIYVQYRTSPPRYP